MPAPRSVARFNRVVTNRILGPLAPYLPGFGIVEHVGRKSQRVYHTPVNVFRHPGGYVFALTYGPDADWVRNVLTNGGCTLCTRGQTVRLSAPRLVHDEARTMMPVPVRQFLGTMNVYDFLVMDAYVAQ